jgi:hypothetical protein
VRGMFLENYLEDYNKHQPPPSIKGGDGELKMK